MQNQPNDNIFVKYTPFELDSRFPVLDAGDIYREVKDFPVSQLDNHNCLELGYCHEGSGIFVVNDKIFPYSGGDAFIVFKNQFHMAKSDNGTVSRWSFILVDPVKLLMPLKPDNLQHIIKASNGDDKFSNLITKSSRPDILNLIVDITTEFQENRNHYQTVICGLILSLMTKLTRLVKVEGLVNESKYQSFERIIPALNYIAANYENHIDIGSLSNLCKISLTSFRRIFGTVMGISPLEYIIRFRINMAEALLNETDLLVIDIARKVGYDSLSSFNRHFRRVVGIPPRDYRKG